MPANTFETWLKKQHVVAKQVSPVAAVPKNTYEEWIQKQVTEMQSKPEERRETELNVTETSREQLSVSV